MEVNLTAGAIRKIMNGEVTSEMSPVLQITELKVVKSQLDPGKERYRLVLSDGTHTEQGILGTAMNELARDKVLQAGSIVQLTQFVCSEIQKRRLVIVGELKVIRTNCDIIGCHVNKRGADSGNNSKTTGSEQHGKSESTVNNTETERSYAPITPQVGQRQVFGTGSSFPVSTTSTGAFGNGVSRQDHARVTPTTYPPTTTSTGHGVSRQDHARDPPTSYLPTTASTVHGVSRQDHAHNPPTTYPPTTTSTGHGVSRQDHARDPPTTYPRQSAYQPQAQPQPSMYGNRGPVARNEASPRIIPINALSPYSGRWTIKARVTSKGELRHYNNQRGDGKVFNFDLLDADGGEIRVTCFNAVADQFFDQIVVGNLYLVSRGSLRPAQKNFNHLPNDYEITLDNASTIQQCYEEDATIPRHQFHFRSIGDIESMDNNSIIDVIGIVSSISPTGSIMRKNGTETQKRALQLKDMSGRSVEVTMWGNFCNVEGQKLQSLCDSGGFPVLAVKAGRISEFNGKAVSTIGSSQLFIDPDFVEARELKDWFEREGKVAPCISISREFSGSGKVDVRKTISQIKDEKLGTSEKPDWITVNATIIYMKFDNFCYTACPLMNGDRPCSKKVTDNGDGTWRCEKCDKCVDECDYRYILQLQIQDHTDLTWVTAFQEAGEEIMGMAAKDLYYIKYEDKDEAKFEDIIRRVSFTKYIFKLKVKEETFSDEQRVKSTVVKVDKLNYSSDTRTILDAMAKLRAVDATLPIKPEGSHYSSDVLNSNVGTSGTRDCPSATRQPQGQYMGGGIPRQHVGSY